MKTPCEYCRKGRRVHIETDGMGGTIDRVEPCDCEDARWRRSECVECGVHVPRKNPNRLGRKRCPKHYREHERERSRRNEAKRYWQDPERARAQFRVRYHTDPEYQRQCRERAEEYRRMRQEIAA